MLINYCYIIYLQVLNQIKLSATITDTFNRTWNYKSGSKSILLSFAVSIGLQLTTLPNELIDDIKNNLTMNANNIIPPGYVLTNENIMVLAFQPNCEYILC